MQLFGSQSQDMNCLHLVVLCGAMFPQDMHLSQGWNYRFYCGSLDTLQTSVWHDSVVILSRIHTRCDSMTKVVIITGGVFITKLWTPIRLKFCLHLVFVVLSNTPERHALGLSLSASTVDPWTPYRRPSVLQDMHTRVRAGVIT